MGVTAALYRREKTGKGSLVDACLLRSGMFSAQLVMVRPNRLMCKAEGVKRMGLKEPNVHRSSS